jgi:hypothetical protein
MIRQASRRLAGILLVVSPTVESGAYFLLTQLIMPASDYTENPIRQNLSVPAMVRRFAMLMKPTSQQGEGVGGASGLLALGVRLPGKTAL